MNSILRLLIILPLVLASALSARLALAADSQREPLVVFAAASLTDVLQQIGPLYTRQSNVPVKSAVPVGVAPPMVMAIWASPTTSPPSLSKRRVMRLVV